jgi:DNA-binding beta-propeller fold protein YncE
MKLRLLILSLMVFVVAGLFGQVLEPLVTFTDNPTTYSMHLCTDGGHYYTVNGGVAKDGKISKFKLNGEFVESYPINQDMRSIMFSKKDKSLYINIKGKEIYKIIDISNGTVQLLLSGIYENEQTTLAIDPKGKFFYALNNGDLSVYQVKTGKLVKKISGLKCGSKGMKGSTTVAVDNKFLYTWDADTRTVFVYTKNGVFKSSFILKSGNIGHSLSTAYGLVFVAKSEMGKTSTWYGYKLPTN